MTVMRCCGTGARRVRGELNEEAVRGRVREGREDSPPRPGGIE